MSYKKLIVDVVIIAMAFIIFIIWHQNSINRSTMTTSFPNDRNIDVYLITTDKGYQYWDMMNQGAKDMAALMRINYIWEAPADRSTEGQIELINSAVDAGAEALIIAADDPRRISEAIRDAKAKGVKIVYVDSPADEEAIVTLATDNYAAGLRAGQTMLTILEDTGKTSGSIGIVNLSDKANTKLREDGFRDRLEQDGRFQLLETIYTERDDPEEARTAAERMMEENEELVALFGTSEGTSIGVGNAIKASGKDYVGIGFDKTDAMTRLLREGGLKAIIDQNPYTMGYLGVAQAVAAINGEDTGPEYINTGVSVLIYY